MKATSVESSHSRKMNVSYYPNNSLDLDDFSSSEDFFAKTFEDPFINLVSACIYLLGCIGVSAMVFVIWYERTGRAGHYRTLVNQIVTFNLEQLIIYYIVATGFDLLRILIGPWPKWLCVFVTFVKNFVNFNVIFICLVLSATNYTFIGIYKSMPCIDDNFISAYLHISLNMLSFIYAAIIIYMPGKPRLNQVTLKRNKVNQMQIS